MRWRSSLGTALLLVCLAAPVAGQEATHPEDQWLRLGRFRGSTSSALMQKLNDYLFEGERSGQDVCRRIGVSSRSGQPEGLQSFEALLGEGTKVSYHPLRRAAARGNGAEVLSHQTRRGGRRVNTLDLGIFSPFGFKDRKTLTSDLVQVGDQTLRDMTVARARDYRKRIFGDRSWNKRFLVTAQGPEDWRSQLQEPGEPSVRTFAVNMLTGYRSDQAEGAEVRRQADLLLGPEYRDTWSSDGDRRQWSKRSSRKQFRQQLPDGLESLSQPREKELNLKQRARFARRAVRKFHQVLELIAEPDCLSCMGKISTKQKDIVILQMVLFRLASREGQNQPGYRYEVFIDSMLRPRSVGNGLFFEYGLSLPDSAAGEPEVLESAERGVDIAQQSAGQSYSGWSGDETFVDSSNPRFQAGELFLSIGQQVVGDYSAPCWKLRLFSDLKFAADLSLRLDLRISDAIKVDQPVGVFLVPLGESTEVVQSPFTLSRFSYDIALPAVSDLEPKTSYAILMRVLNADGRSVSEEEGVRFEWPEVGFSRAAPNCRGEVSDG